MQPLELAMRRNLARNAQVTNKDYLLRLFTKFDVDHSGNFNLEEFIAAITHLGDKHKLDLSYKRVYLAMDANGDGQVEFDEFVSILGEFETASLFDSFKAIVIDLDYSSTFEISTNDLLDFFRRYDVKVKVTEVLKMFDNKEKKNSCLN